MKQKSYSIIDDNKTLIHENIYNENGNITHSINYNESPPVEQFFEYNAEGLLIKQIEVQEGIENSSQIFEYDDEDEVVDEKLFINGLLYEHTKITKTDKTYTKVMIQDGIEVERLEKIYDGKDWTNNFFQHDELLESQEYIYNSKDNSGVLNIQVFGDEQKFLIQEKYNDDNETILREEFHENGSLLISTATEFKNGLIIKETIEDFGNSEGKYQNLYEYDENQNTILFECLSSTGALHSFHRKKYDSKNRLIEESGFSNGFFSGITGIHENHDRFHILHEYE